MPEMMNRSGTYSVNKDQRKTMGSMRKKKMAKMMGVNCSQSMRNNKTMPMGMV